jgi:hypothetical protein
MVKSPSKTVIDVYFSGRPSAAFLRQVAINEITKKQPVDGADASHQHEHTIKLTEHERWHPAKRTKRCGITQFRIRGVPRIDALDNLQGLVLADFEFTNRDDQLAFTMPDFCLADVTQEQAIAGGVLAGKTFAQVAPKLQKYAYKVLHNMI